MFIDKSEINAQVHQYCEGDMPDVFDSYNNQMGLSQVVSNYLQGIIYFNADF